MSNIADYHIETSPHQEAHEVATPNTDADPDDADLEEKADDLLSACKDLAL